jgi:hypothetical protein
MERGDEIIRSATARTAAGLTELETKEARNQCGIPVSPDLAEPTVMAFTKVIPQQTTWTPSPQGYQISAV